MKPLVYLFIPYLANMRHTINTIDENCTRGFICIISFNPLRIFVCYVLFLVTYYIVLLWTHLFLFYSVIHF